MAAGPKRVLLLVLMTCATLLFAALGVWQVERRAGKLALIAAVAARSHASPVTAPPPARWPAMTAKTDEYRHIFAEGTLLNGRETLVQALTEQGPGYWVLTPLRTRAGFTLLVNRGYVPEERRERASRLRGLPGGTVRVTGLLRMSEPGGRFLRANRPDLDRWYARDVAAIARRRGIGIVAPYFIDADATPNPGGWPVGGLTVVAFPNNHLAYAITWFALAAMSGGAFVAFWRGAAREA